MSTTRKEALQLLVAILCSFLVVSCNAFVGSLPLLPLHKVAFETSPSQHFFPQLHSRATTSRATRKTTTRTLILSAASKSEEKSSDDNDKKLKNNMPRALGTLNTATIVGIAGASTIVWHAWASGVPRLFKQHVIGAAIGGLIFFPAGIGAIRSRLEAVKIMSAQKEPAKNRRTALLRHVTAHLYLTYVTAAFAMVSLSSIFIHKRTMGKAHFLSTHSRIGVIAVFLWIASYIVAQIKVWTPMLKRGELKYDPALLWASRLHKNLGIGASVISLLAVASGVAITAWGRNTFAPITRRIILLAILYIQIYCLSPQIQEWRKSMARRRS